MNYPMKEIRKIWNVLINWKRKGKSINLITFFNCLNDVWKKNDNPNSVNVLFNLKQKCKYYDKTASEIP
jgi:hypothetical protein